MVLAPSGPGGAAVLLRGHLPAGDGPQQAGHDHPLLPLQTFQDYTVGTILDAEFDPRRSTTFLSFTTRTKGPIWS